MAAGADAVTATNRAYAALAGTVQRQAAMVSFVAIFQLLGILFLALLPLILLMKRPAHSADVPAAHQQTQNEAKHHKTAREKVCDAGFLHGCSPEVVNCRWRIDTLLWCVFGCASDSSS